MNIKQGRCESSVEVVCPCEHSKGAVLAVCHYKLSDFHNKVFLLFLCYNTDEVCHSDTLVHLCEHACSKSSGSLNTRVGTTCSHSRGSDTRVNTRETDDISSVISRALEFPL